MYIKFFLIFLLTAVTYELGFAQPLPILKKVLVYVLLFIGTFPLAILNAMGLPMIPALCVAVVVLLFARLRRKDVKSMREKEQRG
ncbi:YlaH-like family protein [Aneurinibacillus sp. REN35]|uniref:YlaH-like family protein n=1 Tax=Aneurinibacillus sp. REN35 TaxID=3237286 RepID=UPI0035294E36